MSAQPTFELIIDELVLDGLGGVDGARLIEGLRAELAARIAARPELLAAGSGEQPAADGALEYRPEMSDAALGRALAHVVISTLSSSASQSGSSARRER